MPTGAEDIQAARLRALAEIHRLSSERINGVGLREYGPYYKGKYGVEKLYRMTLEEVADIYSYAVEFNREERPANEAERYCVETAIADLVLALEAQHAAPDLPAPGEPYTQPEDDLPQDGDPARTGPPLWAGG